MSLPPSRSSSSASSSSSMDVNHRCPVTSARSSWQIWRLFCSSIICPPATHTIQLFRHFSPFPISRFPFPIFMSFTFSFSFCFICEFVVSFFGTNVGGKEKEKGRRRLGKTPELVFAARRVESSQVESSLFRTRHKSISMTSCCHHGPIQHS